MRDNKGGCILTVHVQPNAPRTECVGMHGDALKIRLAARPIHGAANEELIRFIADCCAVPRADVRIDAGAEARHKRVYVKGLTAEVLRIRLMPDGRKKRVRT
jgi:uncharacterized protein (TIGR00251 family)